MTPGPVVFSPDVMRVMSSVAYEHTSPDFVEIHGEALRKFRRVIGADNSSPVFIVPGSGTLAMEIALLNTVRPGSSVLVVSHGYFGDRWEEISRANGYEVDVLRSGPGDVVSLDLVEERLSQKRYEAVLATHVETSTGVRTDVRGLASVTRRHDTLLIIDGIASIAAEPMYCRDWGVDVVLTASQKALETPPGLALLGLCSDKAVRSMEEVSETLRGYYTRLKNWRRTMEASERGEVAYFATPATHLVVALERSLSKILSEGLERRYERHRILARALREGLRAMGLEIVARREEIAANTITAVYLPPGIDPLQVRRSMFSGNIVVAIPIHPALRGRSIRIGHMGSVNHNDIIATLALLERVLKRMGASIELGRGLRRAQEVFYEESL